MNFRLLRYFLAVANNLSFSRAAENMHVAQSTLSQQIQQLEEYYGVQLFDRQGRTITLTPAGIEFQDFASNMLASETLLRQRLQMINNGKHTMNYPLRVFFDLHMTRDPYLPDDLVAVILELQEELKDRFFFRPVFLTHDLDSPDSDLSDILNNPQIDFWLIGSEGGMPSSDINFELIYEDRFLLMISKMHPLYRDGLSLEDLPHILNESTLFMIQKRSKYLSAVLDALPTGEEIHPNIRFEASADVIGFYVSMGMGVSIIPENTRDSRVSTDVVSIPIPGSHFYTLAGYRKKSSNPVLPILLQRLKERIKQHELE